MPCAMSTHKNFLQRRLEVHPNLLFSPLNCCKNCACYSPKQPFPRNSRKSSKSRKRHREQTQRETKYRSRQRLIQSCSRMFPKRRGTKSLQRSNRVFRDGKSAPTCAGGTPNTQPLSNLFLTVTSTKRERRNKKRRVRILFCVKPLMSTERTRQETASAYAAHLKERFEQKGILREIAGYPNFVVWHYKEENGQRKKPPINPNTRLPASPADRTTWATLASALSAVATGNYQGIGFMLSYSPFSGIDLDHCIREGRLQPWAQEIIETLNTYTEYSPSWNKAAGTGGVHLLVEGKPPASKKAGNIEVYGKKHYLTITTNHVPGTPTTINSRQEALDALYRRIAPPVVERPYQNKRLGQAGGMLTELPEEAVHDLVLQKLLQGDITGYASQSSADFVLIMKLLQWTGDNTPLVRELFLASPFGQRDKAERPTGETTYIDMTIENVIKKRRNQPMRR